MGVLAQEPRTLFHPIGILLIVDRPTLVEEVS